MTFITKVLLLCFPILLTIGFATTNVVVSVNILLLNDLPTPYQPPKYVKVHTGENKIYR